MKRFIGLLSVIVLLAACHHPVKTRHGTSLPPELLHIDTLMQTRPDSALSLLLDAPMNNPYYQLLLSEALYKNDSAQLNRPELLAAMAYFDSVGCPFLSARCHYMNGVGYYEMDSVVFACEEYLKALEIMEEHFKEKDLVGYKAKFMALVYSHLCVLFTDQYLHVQAVGFAQKTYYYYLRYGSSPQQSAWALNKIGVNYDMMEQLDSAAVYYQKAVTALGDTNSLIYRDIATHQALIDHKMGVGLDKTVTKLKNLLVQTQTDYELLARYLVLGEVFYYEKNFDSAEVYLKKVFSESTSVVMTKQAAEWLVEIQKAGGNFSEAQRYADYLVPFANLNENQSFIKSQMVDSYQDYKQRRLEHLQLLQDKKNQQLAAIIIGVILLGIILFVVLYYIKSKQLKKERHEHKIKQAALAGRLKHSNAALKKEKMVFHEREVLRKIDYSSETEYQNEPICRHILAVCHDERNLIKSNISASAYTNIALTQAQEAELKVVALRHYGLLFEKLKSAYPELKDKDFLYCYLCLLGLDNSQIAVMTQHSYRTIWEREKRLKQLFNSNEKISVILHGFLIG